MLPDKVTLNNGVEMPSIGYGTWQVPAREARKAVLWALEAGYRLIDTSLAYWNEREVGQAVRDSGLPREEVFVTTKLENDDHGRERTLEGFRKSMANLDLGYIDLYLIHWPGGTKRIETWKAMEELLQLDECRAIGVSNYMIGHLEEVLEQGSIVPAVNQVELHPFLYPRELIEFCRGHSIQIESYSPLMKAQHLFHPLIAQVSGEHERTPAQVVLRWHLQHDLIPIPRSVSREHIEENIRVFDFSLTTADMKALDFLDRALHLDWDPTGVM